MNIFYNLFSHSPLHKKNNKLIKTITGDFSYSFDISYESVLMEFSKNPIACRCVQIISNAICDFDFKIKNFQFNKSGKIQSSNDFWSSLVFSLMISGNCFIYIKDNKCEILNTNNIKILYQDNIHIGYELYNIPDIKNNMRFLSLLSIIHLRLPSFSNEDFGSSPSLVLYTEFKNYREISNFITSTMKNGLRSSGIFSYGGNKDDEKIIREEMQELYDKMNGNSAIMIMDGDYKWQSIGHNPEHLEVGERLQENINIIARGYGVPLSLIGINEKYNSRSYDEVRRLFITDTIKPLKNLILNGINCHFNHINNTDNEIYISDNNT